MYRKRLIWTVLIAAILFYSNAKGVQIQVSWDGGGDGISWEDANNWNPDIVPNNTGDTSFFVTIEANEGSPEIEIVVTESITIDRMNCSSHRYGDIDLGTQNPNGLEMRFLDPNGLTNQGSGVLELFGDDYGSLTIFGNVRNTMEAELEFWVDVEISDGDLFNDVNGTIQAGRDDLSVENLENRGTLVLDPKAYLFVDNTINNFGLIDFKGANCECDGTIINKSNGIIQGYGIVKFDGFLQNEGKIISSSGSLVIMSDQYLTNTGTLQNNPVSQLHIQTPVEVNNLGIIQVSAGGGITFDNNLTNNSNSVIELLGGTLSTPSLIQFPDTSFVGFGAISGNVIIEENGIIKLSGPTNIFGNVEIETNATLEVSDGTTLVTGLTTNDGTIHMKGGRLIPQGGLTNNGNVLWEPGLYNNIADFNLDGRVNLH